VRRGGYHRALSSVSRPAGVFGYLLAGMIVGPHNPIPLVADEAMIETLSELGSFCSCSR
jgi:Kef-type K+ transport system membrane component KefB